MMLVAALPHPYWEVITRVAENQVKYFPDEKQLDALCSTLALAYYRKADEIKGDILIIIDQLAAHNEMKNEK
jgi:hypothetical protein